MRPERYEVDQYIAALPQGDGFSYFFRSLSQNQRNAYLDESVADSNDQDTPRSVFELAIIAAYLDREAEERVAAPPPKKDKSRCSEDLRKMHLCFDGSPNGPLILWDEMKPKHREAALDYALYEFETRRIRDLNRYSDRVICAAMALAHEDAIGMTESFKALAARWRWLVKTYGSAGLKRTLNAARKLRN